MHHYHTRYQLLPYRSYAFPNKEKHGAQIMTKTDKPSEDPSIDLITKILFPIQKRSPSKPDATQILHPNLLIGIQIRIRVVSNSN